MAYKTDLISWWSMDEASGNRVDSHGANTLSDINTVTNMAGIVSNGSLHNSANVEHLEINDNASLSITTAFSLAFWLKSSSAAASDSGIIDKSSDYACTTGYAVRLGGTGGADDHLMYFLKGAEFITGAHVFNDNTWRFIVCRYDGADTMEILVDDVQDAFSAAKNNAVVDNAGKLQFGCRSYIVQANVCMNGGLDEVGLWERWLTDAEATWLYNAGAGRAYSELDAFIPTTTTIF